MPTESTTTNPSVHRRSTVWSDAAFKTCRSLHNLQGMRHGAYKNTQNHDSSRPTCFGSSSLVVVTDSSGVGDTDADDQAGGCGERDRERESDAVSPCSSPTLLCQLTCEERATATTRKQRNTQLCRHGEIGKFWCVNIRPTRAQELLFLISKRWFRIPRARFS